MTMLRACLVLILLLSCTGCDRLYALLHKPGGEERANLGAFEYNSFNPKVERLQQILRAFGYTSGIPDGKFGVSTREAVARFQKDEGLEITRFVDKATWGRMDEWMESGFFKAMALYGKAVQTALRKAGFFSGKADGRIGPRTREAVKAFQSSQGLAADGNIGLKTLRALRPYGAGSPRPL